MILRFSTCFLLNSHIKRIAVYVCHCDILVNQFSPTFWNLLICLFFFLMIIISRGDNCKTSEFHFASTWRARETTKRLFSIPSWSKPCWWRSVLLDFVTYLLRSFFFGDQFLGNIMLCKCMPSISQKTNAKFSWEYRACFFIGVTKRTSYKRFFFSNRRKFTSIFIWNASVFLF